MHRALCWSRIRLMPSIAPCLSLCVPGLGAGQGLVHFGVGDEAVRGVHDELAAAGRGEGHHHAGLLLHHARAQGHGVTDVHQLTQGHGARARAAPGPEHLRKFAGLLFLSFTKTLLGPEISLSFLLQDQPIVNHVSKGQAFHLLCQRLKAVNLVRELLQVNVKEVLRRFYLTQAERV